MARYYNTALRLLCQIWYAYIVHVRTFALLGGIVVGNFLIRQSNINAVLQPV
jgi:hypothetical protein